ncbi:hypothetical protein KEM56_002093, partial [Ascosphaera pollenicola]
KRAFQTQFKRWRFPSKQNPAHKNAPLVARIKELWEHNVNQREMLRILHEEGFDIKEREVMRVRARNRWLLRVPNGTRSKEHIHESEVELPGTSPGSEAGPGQEHEASPLLALQNESTLGHPQPLLSYSQYDTARPVSRAMMIEAKPHAHPPGQSLQAAAAATAAAATAAAATAAAATAAAATAARRQERLERLRMESTERWAARKRRRRTKGWAGLPADPPGPPRFPSETTIDESKRYLSLTNDMYRQIRDRFQGICEEFGFLKKTEAGPEKWQAAKTKLISEISHLQSVLWDSQSPSKTDVKSLALDVLCTDVTKRMRTIQRRMTIAEAKNTLGINPEESRDLRNAFYDILKVDHFTNKLEAGDAHWNELKNRWIQSSPTLQNILASGPSDPSHLIRMRAIEVLCRDVMKRFRDDQTRRAVSHGKASSASNIGQHPVQQHADNHAEPNYVSPPQDATEIRIRNGISTLASQALASAPISDLQIDPTLLRAAASDANLVSDPPNNTVPENVTAGKETGAAGFRPETIARHSRTSQSPPNHEEFSQSSICPRYSPEFALAQGQSHQPPSVPYVDPELNAEHRLCTPLATFCIHPDSNANLDIEQWVDRLLDGTISSLQQVVYSHVQHSHGSEGHDNDTSIVISRMEAVWFDNTGTKVVSQINDDRDLDTYLQSLAGNPAIFALVITTQ